MDKLQELKEKRFRFIHRIVGDARAKSKELNNFLHKKP